MALGALLIFISGCYLWKDTIRPILGARFDLDHLSDTLKLGVRYWSWKDRAEDARRKAIEADLERMKQQEKKDEEDAGRNPSSSPISQ
jgi:hypothetical protein